MHLTHSYAMAFPFHQYPTLPAPAIQDTTAHVTKIGAAVSQERSGRVSLLCVNTAGDVLQLALINV